MNIDPRKWFDARDLAAFALRSPARLAAVVGAAAVVAIMLAHVLTPAVPATPTRPAEPAAASSGHPSGPATPTVTVTPDHQTAGHTPSPTPAPGPNLADMTQLAGTFVATWADHGLTRDQWFTAVHPMITDRLARELKYTKPANVPASQVTGAVTVDPGPPITADVPTDAGTVRVIIVKAGQDYRVDRII